MREAHKSVVAVKGLLATSFTDFIGDQWFVNFGTAIANINEYRSRASPPQSAAEHELNI